MNLENLQFLFKDPIIQQSELSPGYEDHASDVWLVQTENEEVVVRTTKMVERPNNDFWHGCNKLFGVDPRNVHEMEYINNTLREFSLLPVPRVIRKGSRDDKQYIVVEKLDGVVCRSFVDQPETLVESLGRGIASIHAFKSDFVGTASGSFRSSIQNFHHALSDTMSEIVGLFYKDDIQAQQLLPQMIAILKDIPAPTHASFILVDMDASQFITNREVITGLVDTEVYVLGPRELDFIGLEYIMNKDSADVFKNAYQKQLSLPDLELCRIPYRFFYRLLRVQGRVDWEKWLNYPALF
ncbi:phosphotransferase [Paenibacillus rhizovicinus]|uniref:Phosphotransferase n=1 Tax=Paenibacillus rhizovicinus TaxID=2704463 RepID=A0A6C0NTZ1_9BACL|nr:phosphotransferase [Paenibacillus rhizovicinus]QHW29645.1 phosphotransferase [Paenibacillus rhizovicinus]